MVEAATPVANQFDRLYDQSRAAWAHFPSPLAREGGRGHPVALRRAAAAYRTTDDDAVLDGMIAQMLKTTEQAEQAIDNALALVEASNQRIAAMESNRRG